MALGALPERIGFPEARLLRRNVVTAVFAAVGAGGLILMRRSAGRLAADAREASGPFRRLLKSRLAVFSLLMIVLLLGTGLSKVIRYTPHVFDVLSYHLEPVARWHQEGRMPVTIPVTQWQQDAWKPATSPTGASSVFENANREFLGGSLLNLWAFWFFDNIVIIALPAVVFSIGLCLALYRILRFLSIRAPMALFFTAAIMSTPAVLMHMDTCKNYTFYVYPWVSLTFLLAENLTGIDRRRLILGAFPFALAWSSKIVSTFVLPLTLGVFLAAYLLAHRRRIVRIVKKDALFAVAFAAACLVLAGSTSWFWVYRNYVNDGTYFMRLKEQSWALTISGMQEEYDNAPFRDSFEGLPFAKNIRILMGNVTSYASRVQDPCVRGDTYEFDGKFASNFGLIYFSFGQAFLLLYLLLFARRRLKPRRAALFFLAAAGIMAMLAHWSVYFNPYSYRSHLFWPLMTLPISLYALRVMTAGRLRTLCVALITVGILFHWWTTLYDANRTTDERRIITDNLPLMNRPIAQYWHAGAVDAGVFDFRRRREAGAALRRSTISFSPFTIRPSGAE